MAHRVRRRDRQFGQDAAGRRGLRDNPGLGGMSRIGNSPELDRLQDDRPTLPQYFAISSDFSMEKVGWKFWRLFYDPLKRIEEKLAGIVFDGPNDLVVDTASMTYMTKGWG